MVNQTWLEIFISPKLKFNFYPKKKIIFFFVLLIYFYFSYLYLNNYEEVAKICGKKNKPEYLSLAALAAKKYGCHELELLEATKGLIKCLQIKNFDLARRICCDHSDLKVRITILLVFHKVFFFL